MLCRFNNFSRIFAALFLGGLGILGWIDQTTMIMLVVILCILPNRDCLPAARKA